MNKYMNTQQSKFSDNRISSISSQILYLIVAVKSNVKILLTCSKQNLISLLSQRTSKCFWISVNGLNTKKFSKASTYIK